MRYVWILSSSHTTQWSIQARTFEMNGFSVNFVCPGSKNWLGFLPQKWTILLILELGFIKQTLGMSFGFLLMFMNVQLKVSKHFCSFLRQEIQTSFAFWIDKSHIDVCSITEFHIFRRYHYNFITQKWIIIGGPIRFCVQWVQENCRFVSLQHCF